MFENVNGRRTDDGRRTRGTYEPSLCIYYSFLHVITLILVTTIDLLVSVKGVLPVKDSDVEKGNLRIKEDIKVLLTK